ERLQDFHLHREALVVAVIIVIILIIVIPARHRWILLLLARADKPAGMERPTSPFARAPKPLPRTARFVESRLIADVQYLVGASSLRPAKIEGVRVRSSRG